MKKLLPLVLIALLLNLAAAQSVKIAFMGPLTGGAASIGQEALGFTKVVVDAFNERTGMNVELVQGRHRNQPGRGPRRRRTARRRPRPLRGRRPDGQPGLRGDAADF